MEKLKIYIIKCNYYKWTRWKLNFRSKWPFDEYLEIIIWKSTIKQLSEWKLFGILAILNVKNARNISKIKWVIVWELCLTTADNPKFQLKPSSFQHEPEYIEHDFWPYKNKK